MVEYNPSRDKIDIFGTLVSISQAERMVDELENALEMAEFHNELTGDVNYSGRALDHLHNPSEKSYPMNVTATVENDGDIPKEMFSSIEMEREFSDLYRVEGIAKACYIKPIHDTSDGLISFNVSMP